MAVVEISIPSGPSTEQTVTLESVTITLRIWWNSRAQRWFLDVSDAAGAAIASGLGFVVGRSLLERFGVRKDTPPGALIAMDASALGIEAGREDLGARVRLYYFDAADIVAAEAARVAAEAAA